jgi:hypothetical protein
MDLKARDFSEGQAKLARGGVAITGSGPSSSPESFPGCAHPAAATQNWPSFAAAYGAKGVSGGGGVHAQNFGIV